MSSRDCPICFPPALLLLSVAAVSPLAAQQPWAGLPGVSFDDQKLVFDLDPEQPTSPATTSFACGD